MGINSIQSYNGSYKPDYGSIIINNQNAIKFPIAERAKIFNLGYVPQYGGFFHDLTLLENLRAIAEIQIKNFKQRNNRIEKLSINLNLIQ